MNQDIFAITIPCRGFGKERPRVTRHGTYMRDEYTSRMAQVSAEVGMLPDWCYNAPVGLHVTAMFAMPKSWSKKKRESMRGKLKESTPDGDNLVGAIMDALWPKERGGDSRVFLDGERRRWGDEDWIKIIIVEIE
jgi:Holliday junction resolvase RusA-like endonuclease